MPRIKGESVPRGKSWNRRLKVIRGLSVHPCFSRMLHVYYRSTHCCLKGLKRSMIRPFLHMKVSSKILTLIAGVWLPIAAVAETKAPATEEKISFYTQVRPIFQVHCVGCHQPAKAKGVT